MQHPPGTPPRLELGYIVVSGYPRRPAVVTVNSSGPRVVSAVNRPRSARYAAFADRALRPKA